MTKSVELKLCSDIVINSELRIIDDENSFTKNFSLKL